MARKDLNARCIEVLRVVLVGVGTSKEGKEEKVKGGGFYVLIFRSDDGT
jgi:hypothetical protein